MAKNRVIIKIVILIIALIYFLLAQTLVVTGNTTEDNVIKNVGNNATNNSIKSVEPNKDKETNYNICTQCLFKGYCVRHLSQLWYISYRSRVIKG